MIQTYRILTIILYPLLFLFLYYRRLINKEDPKRFKEKILVSKFNVKRKEKSKLFWFHASSIGEFKSILPIIYELNSRDKDVQFLITTTTFSSGNLAKKELKRFINVEHRFLPFDVIFLIDKFLRLWKPDKIFLVDSEIWPNLILKARDYNIPIAILNARLTNRSFDRWKIFPKTARKIFGVFDLCLCCNNQTKKYLKKLKAKNVYFKGNIKLINQIKIRKYLDINGKFLLMKKFWFAASIHQGEDIFCLKTHLKLKKKFKDIITIIAPRHIERSKEIKSLSESLNLSTQILNQNDHISKNKEIIIINYFGALNNYFKYAKSIFMGKSIIKELKNNSGQNPIEAAKLNCKIYHGPYVYNFEDIYKIFKNRKISKKIKNFEELSNNLISDLRKTKKKRNIDNSIDILGKETLKSTMVLIKKFLYDKIY
tara:strand:+ start:2663 stop:3943 length:1281 start_codon:yes stop_codon:yes gene_type:complete